MDSLEILLLERSRAHSSSCSFDKKGLDDCDKAKADENQSNADGASSKIERDVFMVERNLTVLLFYRSIVMND